MTTDIDCDNHGCEIFRWKESRDVLFARGRVFKVSLIETKCVTVDGGLGKHSLKW